MSKLSERCTAWWSDMTYYPKYILPISCALALLSLLPFIAMFIKAFRDKQLSSETRLSYLSFAFFIVICLYYLTAALWPASMCADWGSDKLYFSLDMVTNAAYGLQGVLLWVNLFLRLLFIFRDSVLAVSKCTKFGFGIMAVAVVVLTGVAGIADMADYNEESAMFIALGFLLYIAQVIWLNALFAYKLIKVHQTNKDTVVYDRGLVYVAIKTSLLCFISSCSTAIYGTGLVFATNAVIINSPHFNFVVYGILVVCDLHTNFFSVLLTFKHFEPWYKQLCGRQCHQQCHRICLKCIGDAKETSDAKMVSGALALESAGSGQAVQTK